MITKTDSRGVQNGKELVRLAFKSTDSKPTTGIMNGSTGIEVNTGKQYVYDEESGEWTEIASSGGGGGGSSDFSTAEVTIISTGDSIMFPLPALYETEGEMPAQISVENVATGNNTFTVPLYKGLCGVTIWGATSVQCTGNAEYEDGFVQITGDCTITIS